MYSSLFINIIFFCAILCKQVNAQNIEVLSSSAVTESLNVTADRFYYFTGEQILFNSFYANNLPNNEAWSAVLYVELIQPDGVPVQQLKSPIKNNIATGYIQIPEKTITGTYYLKAYTKWMRNQSVAEYAFDQIQIINPENTNELKILSDSEQVLFETNTIKNENQINIRLSETKVTSRNNLQISIDAQTDLPSDTKFQINVINKGLNHNRSVRSVSKNQSQYNLPAHFLPEPLGITLSGKIKSSNAVPLAGANINISVLNSRKYFITGQTNYAGNFSCLLPPSDHKLELYFKLADTGQEELSTVFDEEFCTKSLHLPSPSYSPDSIEKEIIKQAYVNYQLKNRFANGTPLKEKEIGNTKGLFGGAAKVYYIKDYINLFDLAEFLHEIVPEVRVDMNKNKRSIFISTYQGMGPKLQIFVDDIPIIDEMEFLSLSPDNFERLEIIDKIYVVGNILYGGIISAYTKKGDLAGLKISDNTVFLSLNSYGKTLQEQVEEHTEDEKIPDLRNCLFWKSGLSYSDLREKSYTIETSDVKGSFSVLVYGYSKFLDKIYFAEKEFVVE